MSYSLTEILSDIEDGEIPSPPCSQKVSDLEDLSSCEEIFSSDSRTSHSPRNSKHHSKVFRKDRSASNQRKETVVHDKPNGGPKRVHARRRSSMKITECKVIKKDRLRGVQRRERSISFSSDDESEPHRRAVRCSKRRIRRVRNKSKNSDSSLINVIQKKKSEPSKNVGCSYPEKVPPKSSLKRRLMTMISLTSSATNEVGDQGVVSQVDTRSDIEPEATKEIVGGGYVSGNDLCEDNIPKKVNDTPTFKINEEQKKHLEQDSAMQHFPALEKVVIEVQSAEDQHNSSVAGDEDLANLRKLALEALNKKAPVKVQATAAPNDEADDLTELRLRALHSAVLKKHIARKAKAAAAASSAAATTSASSVAVVAPALSPTASTVLLTTAASFSPEEPQADTVGFTNDGNRCADNCDKTTVIVDMDLENTSEEDSQPAGCADNGMQPYRNDSSPYYTPELWTPITEESFDHSFNGSSFPNCGSLDDLNIPLNQPLHIPLVQSMYVSQNVSNIQPIVDHQQTSSNFEPIPITHRNKYSERPNLIKLPVVPMCYDKQTNHSVNIANMYSSCETGASTYANSQSVRGSSLIQINLQAESSTDVNDPIKRNEIHDICDPQDEETLHQRQCHDGGTDASDAENMDISSMIVVDEIDCTSPEPDTTSSVNNSNSDSQSASNILTNVPVPSSQYANRSMLPNSPITTSKTVSKPNQIQRPKLSSSNPFTLNNLRKKTALLKERKVLETGSSIDVELSTRPNFELTRMNQISFSAARGLNNAPPTASKGGPGRFVIHLGEDTDSEDDGQSTNQQFGTLPQRTIINEIALQQNPRVRKPAPLPAQDTASINASLDAFFKQTRALYDLKHAKEKEALQLQGPVTNSGKHTVKELGTDEDLPNTSNFFNVRTVITERNAPVKEPAAGPPLKRRRISVSATETKRIAQHKLVEQGIGKQGHGTGIGKQERGMEMGRPECRTVIGKPESGMETERVATASTTMVAGKRSIQNITVTVGNKAVRMPTATGKRNKHRIIFNTSSVDFVKASNENTAPASGLKAGVHHAPKNVTNTSSTAAKPQNLKASNAVKLVVPSTVLPNRGEKTEFIQPFKSSSAALAVAKPALAIAELSAANEKLALATANDKPSLAAANKKSALSSANVKSALAAANTKSALGSIGQELKPSRSLKHSTPPLSSGKAVRLVRGPLKPPVLGAVNQEIQVKNINSIQTVQSVEMVPQKAHDSRSNHVISESTNQAADERILKLTESRLLRERSSLLVDLTFISDNLNDSSKYDQGIKESVETISQQKKIIELATRSISLARERIANDLKKKSQIFSLINNKRKIVASKRDVCLKLQTECVNLGSKVKGQSYVAPQYLESELSIKLKDVGAEISKSIKCVLPQQKANLPCASTADDVKQSLPDSIEAASVPKTDVSIEVNQLPDAPSESVEENPGKILWLMDCPYERNGICGDVTECPFLHKKHR